MVPRYFHEETSTTAWCKCGNDSLEGRGMNATQQGEQPDAMILEQTKSGPDQHHSVVEKNVHVDSKADPYIDDDDEDYRRARMFLQEFHLRRYRESPHAYLTMTKQHRRHYRFFVSPSAAMAATASLSAIPEEETNSTNNEEICDDDGTYDSNNNTPPSCLRKNIAVPSLASLVSTTSTVEGIRRNGSISAMLCSLSLAEEPQEEQQQQQEQKPLAMKTADACTNHDEWLQQQQLRGSRFSSPDAAMPLDDQWGFFCSSTESSRTSTAITTTTTSATATTVASCARGSHSNHGLLPHRNRQQQQQQQSSDLVHSHHHYRQQPTSHHRVVVQSVGPN